MQRNRFAGPRAKKTDGPRPLLSGRIIILASSALVLIALAALIFAYISKPQDKPIRTESVPSSSPPEPSTATPQPGADTTQVDRTSDKPSFARNLEIESLKAEAVEVAQQLTQDLPGPKSIALLGDVHLNNGNSTKAVELWQKSLEIDPDNAVALNGMAWVAMKKAEYEEAADLWKRAIQIDPNLPGVHGALAGALVCLGKSQEAIDSLKTEIRLSPRPAHSLVMMANQHMLLKNTTRQRPLLRRHSTGNPIT